MASWYAAREDVKRALAIGGGDKDVVIDRALEAASREIDSLVASLPGIPRFLPYTAEREFRWPREVGNPASYRLRLPQRDLIAVTLLRTKAQDSSPTTIAAADYFLEPQWGGPPYHTIEIDLSSTADFEAGTSAQRSVEVTGRWGWREDTVSAGTVSSGLASDAAATSMVCSDASKIDVGDTLLIETEAIFVSGRSFAALGAILINGALTATKSQETVTVDAGHGIVADEVIQIGAERMYVRNVATNDLTVERAWDGTTLAAHADDSAVLINRTLTIERNVHGTTAAVHANATAISRYRVPADVRAVCLAIAISQYEQEQAGYGRSIGMGEGAREFSGRALAALKKEFVDRYSPVRVAAI